MLKGDYKKDFKPFNKNFITKMESTESPMDMYFLLRFLIKQKTDKVILENILNNKKEVWDKGHWSEKFWKVNRENKLNVKESLSYSINKKGQKKYYVRAFIEEKIKSGEISSNPLLYLDYALSDYGTNKLIETLEKINIKDIQIVSKEEALKLYGKRGVDGMLEILGN